MPVAYPAARSMASSRAQVEPFPLVPATVTSGKSNLRSSCCLTLRMRSKLISIGALCTVLIYASQSLNVRLGLVINYILLGLTFVAMRAAGATQIYLEGEEAGIRIIYDNKEAIFSFICLRSMIISIAPWASRNSAR